MVEQGLTPASPSGRRSLNPGAAAGRFPGTLGAGESAGGRGAREGATRAMPRHAFTEPAGTGGPLV